MIRDEASLQASREWLFARGWVVRVQGGRECWMLSDCPGHYVIVDSSQLDAVALVRLESVWRGEALGGAHARALLVPPPGAAEWLAALLLTCGREFGHLPSAFPELVGVLCANVDDATSKQLQRLFFRKP